MTKGEMVKDLAEIMKQKEIKFPKKDLSVDDIYEWLEEDGYLTLNKKQLVDMKDYLLNDLSDGVTSKEMTMWFGENGFLRIVKLLDGDPPTFAFRRTAFLSCFRGYRFQVSGDEYGNGDYGSSQTTLIGDLGVAAQFPKEYQPLIAFSHVCEAVNKYDEFWEIVEEHKSKFNRFMDDTNDMCRTYTKDFDFDRIKDFVKVRSELPAGKIVSRASTCETGMREAEEKLIGILIYADNYVAFREFKSKDWLVIEFETYIEVITDKRSDMDNKDYYRVMWSRLPYILFAFANMTFNFMYIYPKRKKGSVGIPTEGLVTSSEGSDIINAKVVINAKQHLDLVYALVNTLKDIDPDEYNYMKTMNSF
jgi:hypothetical protein